MISPTATSLDPCSTLSQGARRGLDLALERGSSTLELAIVLPEQLSATKSPRPVPLHHTFVLSEAESPRWCTLPHSRSEGVIDRRGHTTLFIHSFISHSL